MGIQMKHTPGPWGATTRQGSWDWVVFSEADSDIEICQMFHDGSKLNKTGEANSRLVAAAPDLLRELRTSRCPGGGYTGQPYSEAPTVENCLKAGVCGCTAGEAVRKATTG